MRGTGWFFLFLVGQLAFCLDALAVLPFRNPISANIPKVAWSIELEDVVTIPNSDNKAPRLEFLTSGGAPGLAYVLDQRGKRGQSQALSNTSPSRTRFRLPTSTSRQPGDPDHWNGPSQNQNRFTKPELQPESLQFIEFQGCRPMTR